MATHYSVTVRNNSGEELAKDQYDSNIRQEINHLAQLCELGEKVKTTRDDEYWTTHTYTNGTIKVLRYRNVPTNLQRRGF